MTTHRASGVADTAKKQEKRYHIVEKGENLFRISRQYSVSVASIMEANRIADASLLHIGDSLLIPSDTDTASSQETPQARQDVIYYKVKDGDTLLRIAAQFGVSVDSLYKENNLKPDSMIAPGNVIKVVKTGHM